MRSAILPLLLLFVSHAASGGESLPKAAPDAASPVRLSTWQPIQGEPVVVEVSPLPRANNVVMAWKGQEIPMRE